MAVSICPACRASAGEPVDTAAAKMVRCIGICRSWILGRRRGMPDTHPVLQAMVDAYGRRLTVDALCRAEDRRLLEIGGMPERQLFVGISGLPSPTPGTYGARLERGRGRRITTTKGEQP